MLTTVNVKSIVEKALGNLSVDVDDVLEVHSFCCGAIELSVEGFISNDPIYDVTLYLEEELESHPDDIFEAALEYLSKKFNRPQLSVKKLKNNITFSQILANIIPREYAEELYIKAAAKSLVETLCSEKVAFCTATTISKQTIGMRVLTAAKFKQVGVSRSGKTGNEITMWLWSKDVKSKRNS